MFILSLLCDLGHLAVLLYSSSSISIGVVSRIANALEGLPSGPHKCYVTTGHKSGGLKHACIGRISFLTIKTTIFIYRYSSIQ
jgi:hypothetical protein